jgi:predicted anti-sigma-YlaC factor YlaD
VADGSGDIWLPAEQFSGLWKCLARLGLAILITFVIAVAIVMIGVVGVVWVRVRLGRSAWSSTASRPLQHQC